MLTESRIIPRMRHLFFPTLVHTVHTPLLKPSWKHYYNNGDIIHHHQGSIQAICPLLRLQLISTTLVFCLLSLSSSPSLSFSPSPLSLFPVSYPSIFPPQCLCLNHISSSCYRPSVVPPLAAVWTLPCVSF